MQAPDKWSSTKTLSFKKLWILQLIVWALIIVAQVIGIAAQSGGARMASVGLLILGTFGLIATILLRRKALATRTQRERQP